MKPFYCAVGAIGLTSAFGVATVKAQPLNTPGIPLKKLKVSVLGEVNRPGTYFMDARASALDLMNLAGGLTTKANPEKVTVLRDKIPISLETVVGKKAPNPAAGFALQKGDVVVVSAKDKADVTNRVVVLGAVKNPGYYEIPKDSTLTAEQAIALAGGAKDGAGTPFKLVPSMPIPDATLPQVAKDAKSDQLLKNGDVLYVPAAPVVRKPGVAQPLPPARLYLLEKLPAR